MPPTSGTCGPATWSNIRDNAAAHDQLARARQVADLLPEADPDRLTMRIAPRTLLCATATRVGGSGAETGFEELRDLCIAAGDQRSLAIATAGRVLEQYFNCSHAEASQTATELVRLLESIGDPTLTLALMTTALSVKQETGEMSEVLRLAERGIELAGGDATKGRFDDGLAADPRRSRCGAWHGAAWESRDGRTTSSGRSRWPATCEPITRLPQCISRTSSRS